MKTFCANTAAGSKPDFLRSPARGTEQAARLKNLLRRRKLSTVCEQARCPNLGNCFGSRTAAFMILGRTCTRQCRFCAVEKGVPQNPDPEEPFRLAETARELGLRHVVITSVTRDDLADRGAGQFARSIAAVKAALPQSTVEVLTPDLGGSRQLLAEVLSARPEVFNHNLETVPRLYESVRPGADYKRSLSLLEWAAQNSPSPVVKSGIMAGLGESKEEIASLMRDLVAAGCAVLTIGQYLAPSRKHWPVARYYEPWEYEELKALGEDLGLKQVFAGPLVRSSFHAGEVYADAAAVLKRQTLAQGDMSR